MSANNGVYILKTLGVKKDWEYRVAYLIAIENLEWDSKHGRPSDDENLHISNARQMWFREPFYKTEAAALKAAANILANLATLEICEYGISFITIRKRF